MKDFNANKDGKRPSASFVVGAVALLFLIVGYQAALFIHKASVARIIANHDEPDTVFVYASENASQAVGVTANERPVASTSSATTQSYNHTPDASMFGEPCQTTGSATDRAGNRSPVAGPAEAASPYRKKPSGVPNASGKAFGTGNGTLAYKSADSQGNNELVAESAEAKYKTGTYRKNSEHSAQVEQIRRHYTPRKYESFRFDPNTVSIDDLMLSLIHI